MKAKAYKFTEEVWIYPSDFASWHFVSVPKSLSFEIKARYGKHARGFGSLPVIATIGKSVWKTSIFPDKRSSTYILPLKASVRTKESVRAGKRVTVAIAIEKGPRL